MPVTTTRLLLKTPHSYGRDPSQPLPKNGRVRTGASILAAIALAAALTVGASAQQQTFSTAHAGPTGPVPIITGQPVNANVYPYYPYPCAGQKTGKKAAKGGATPANGSSKTVQRSPCTGVHPSPRPSRRPSPRPTR
jgi:hypothetical protein